MSDRERLLRFMSLLHGALGYAVNRLAETEGCACSCGSAREVEEDGPCNWCEQAIFAYDLALAAADEIRQLVDPPATAKRRTGRRRARAKGPEA